MKKLYSELNEEAKASYGITEGASNDAWVFCTSCDRAMEQGDCVVGESEGSLQCAYDDCLPEGNLAFQSLYGWDAYRQTHVDETSDWPETPTEGVCYGREGGVSNTAQSE